MRGVGEAPTVLNVQAPPTRFHTGEIHRRNRPPPCQARTRGHQVNSNQPVGDQIPPPDRHSTRARRGQVGGQGVGGGAVEAVAGVALARVARGLVAGPAVTAAARAAPATRALPPPLRTTRWPRSEPRSATSAESSSSTRRQRPRGRDGLGGAGRRRRAPPARLPHRTLRRRTGLNLCGTSTRYAAAAAGLRRRELRRRGLRGGTAAGGRAESAPDRVSTFRCAPIIV